MRISFKNFERLCYQSKDALKYSTKLRIDEDMFVLKYYALLLKMQRLLVRQTPVILKTSMIKISDLDYQRLMLLASYAANAGVRVDK